MEAIKCSGCGANMTIDIENSVATCPYCGSKHHLDKVIVNNTTINYINSPTDTQPNTRTQYSSEVYGKEKNKYIALLLCIFLGFLGAHKFYEGKFGMGVFYIFTLGFFYIGWIIDIIVLLTKPNPYYV